jgi:DNA-binding IclR family transcriptional regulator
MRPSPEAPPSIDFASVPLLDAGLARVAPRTIVTPGRLSAELAAIREAGVSREREESDVGVTCVAAPIVGTDGTAVAAISITGWINRLDPDRLAPAVRTAALGVSRVLRERGRVAAEYPAT